jgi:AraC-like DNA-binding protein
MVRDHIWRVTTGADRISGPAAAHVGQATIELMRALVLSAGGDERSQREAGHMTTAARVQAYVREHLREPDLGPARIAAANGLSRRTLYAIYDELGTSLEQSIIEQRLEGARRDLVDSRRSHVTIAAIAREWGFSTPSFFASRFRRAHGVTPREWRALHAGDRTLHRQDTA